MSVRTDQINLDVNINGNKARSELNKLNKESLKIKESMVGLKKTSDEYLAGQVKLKGLDDQMEKLRNQIGLTALTMKDLSAKRRQLQAILSNTIPDTAEFKKYDKELSTVIARQKELKRNITGIANVAIDTSRITNSIKTLAASYLGLQAVIAGVKGVVSAAVGYSDQLADLQRVAGLTADEARSLSNALKNIDTRTSVTELLNIAIIAGKLGVAKDDISGFTKAVDQLVVSLGDELGDADQITTQLGKILNVFDGKINADNISKLGNAIIKLANDGVASGGFIVDFTQRLSGVAKAANLSLASIVAFGAGLEENGARVESSSTAIQKLILKIGADVPAAAKIAGEDVKTFSDLLANKPQEALLAYAKGLTGNAKAFEEFSAGLKASGDDAGKVAPIISILGQKTEFFKQKIEDTAEALQKTNSSTDAFAIKNQTLAAELDKVGKEFSNFAQGSGVNNFLKGAVENIIEFIKWLKDLPQWINENRITLLLLAAAIIATNAALIKANLIWVYNKAVMAAAAITQGVITTLTLAYRSALLLLAVAQLAVTGNVGRLKAAWQALSIAFKASPIGAIVVTVVALGIALDNAFSKTSRLQKIQNEFQKKSIENYSDQVNKLEQLKKALEDENVGLETKKKLYNELIQINPEFAETLRLDAEGHLSGANAIEQYIKALRRKGDIEAAQELSNEKNKEILSAQAEFDVLSPKLKSGDYTASDLIKLGKLDAKIRAAKEAKKYFDDKLSDLYKNGPSTGTAVFTQPEDTFTPGGGNAAEDATVAARRKELEKLIADSKTGYEKLNATDKAGQQANLALRAKYQAELDALDNKQAGKSGISKNSEYGRLKKEAEDFYKQIEQLKIDAENASKSDDEKELIAVKQKYDALQAKALEFFRKNVTNRKTFTAEEKAIVEAYNREVTELHKKQFAASSEAEYQKSLQQTQDYFDHQRNITGQAYADGKISKAEYSAAVHDIEVREKAQLVSIAEDYFATSKKADADLTKFKKDQEKQQTDDAIANAETRAKVAKEEALAKAQLAVISAPNGSKKQDDAQKALFQLQFEQDTEGLDKKSELYKLKEQQLQNALEQIDEEARQRRIRAAGNFAQGVLSITGNLITALNNLDQRGLQKDKAMNEAKKKNYKNQLDSKLLSQKQYDRLSAKADEDLDKKKQEIAKKQAKRQQAQAIFQTIINTASAVAEALPNIPLSILAGAIGAAELVAIISTPPPEAAKGNWFRKGDKHKDPSGGIPVMIERDEAVVKADAMTDSKSYTVTGTPAQITSKLNSMHGGVNWASGALLRPKFREPAPQISSKMPRIMAQGGLGSGTTAGNGFDTGSLEQLIERKFDEMIQTTKDKRDKLHAVVSIREYREEEKIYDAARRAGGWGG